MLAVVTSMAETIRAFVAVELPDEVKATIRQVEQKLQAGPAARAVKWVDAAQMHITVKFLGDTDTARIPAVEQALNEVARKHAPFALRLAGLGTFPNGPRVRVVWIGLAEGEAPLVALIDDAERALNALGFKPEHHEAHPHVTLGRVRDWAGAGERRETVDGLKAVRVPEFPAAMVDHLSLMQSHLSPQGATYRALHQAALKGQ